LVIGHSHHMSRIALLSEEVASQVAAGEVIERPASVVKELVENSLDAGARRIEVLIKNGGSSMIRVVDDGSGMDRDDALLCLERHATSKIRTGHDLASIATLGFRGEALPSIASVSRFKLTTREHAALAGTEVLINGGRIEHVRDGGDAPGTQIEVRSLFYNLPARRKFLRTENTEASHVEHQLQLQAIGHPATGFVFLNDERLVHQLPSVTNLRDRLRDLLGDPLVAQLLEVPEAERLGITIRGFVGKPGVSRSTRAQQYLFVNGRAVENPTLNAALREGYHTALMKGQFPVTFLFIDMDPAAVDVNVHPAKREVRFREPSVVREALVESVRITLESNRGEWSRTFSPPPAPFAPAPSKPPHEEQPSLPHSAFPAPETELIPPAEQTALRRDWSSFSQRPADTSAPPTPEEPAGDDAGNQNSKLKTQNSFRILGVLGKLYVLMENDTGLVLVDQHAAHERILFEEIRRRMEDQGVPSQRLLMPLTVEMSPRDADWLERNIPTLERMGVGIEPFGAGTFKVDALPQFLRGGDPVQLLRDIIDELNETGGSGKTRLGEDVIAKCACRHAVKANDVLREPELVSLVQDLLACELPYCCPHGRPTMIQISYGELEKKFGRKV
jgi:DNA mismatch repair protein MutL